MHSAWRQAFRKGWEQHAGHVIPDGDTHMFIQNPKDQSMIDLKIATYSVRDEGRPLGRAKDSPNFQDDCGFLIIDEDKLPHFDHLIPCVDPHFYSSSKSGADNSLDPVSPFRRQRIEKQLLSRSRVVVHKRGAATDLTMGYFININDTAPRGWYQSQLDEDNTREWWQDGGDDGDGDVSGSKDMGDNDADDNGDEVIGYDKDDLEWIGVVQWADDPFSAPGDSGSLVFALEEGITVPLGIHVGAPEAMPRHSIFISIETYCYEAEDKEGWELCFTERYRLYLFRCIPTDVATITYTEASLFRSTWVTGIYSLRTL